MQIGKVGEFILELNTRHELSYLQDMIKKRRLEIMNFELGVMRLKKLEVYNKWLKGKSVSKLGFEYKVSGSTIRLYLELVEAWIRNRKRGFAFPKYSDRFRFILDCVITDKKENKNGDR